LSFGLQFALELAQAKIFMFHFMYDTGRGRKNESVSLVKPNITPEVRGSATQPPFTIHGRHSAALILLGLLYV